MTDGFQAWEKIENLEKRVDALEYEAQKRKAITEETMRLADNGCTAKEIRKHLGYGDKED